MTDSQVKYQTLMEDRRHNMALEKYAAKEAEATVMNAKSKAQDVELNKAKLYLDIKRYPDEYALRKEQTRAGTIGMAFSSANQFAQGLKSMYQGIGSLVSLFG